jgi:hypothetical protein
MDVTITPEPARHEDLDRTKKWQLLNDHSNELLKKNYYPTESRIDGRSPHP